MHLNNSKLFLYFFLVLYQNFKINLKTNLSATKQYEFKFVPIYLKKLLKNTIITVLLIANITSKAPTQALGPLPQC